MGHVSLVSEHAIESIGLHCAYILMFSISCIIVGESCLMVLEFEGSKICCSSLTLLLIEMNLESSRKSMNRSTSRLNIGEREM